MLTRIIADRHWSFQFVRYVAIGATVFVIDVGLFQLLVSRGAYLAVAATVGYGVAICVHFTLNKFANFRVHDRPVHEQASTYVVVAAASWLITIVVVEIAVRELGWAPLIGKLVAVVLNLPVGFFGHRFLTFGPGLAARVRQMLWVRSRT